MKEQFKQAISEELEEPNAYESRKVLADVDKAAAECERICEERMGALMKWATENKFSYSRVHERYYRVGFYGRKFYTISQLIKLFNEKNR